MKTRQDKIDILFERGVTLAKKLNKVFNDLCEIDELESDKLREYLMEQVGDDC